MASQKRAPIRRKSWYGWFAMNRVYFRWMMTALACLSMPACFPKSAEAPAAASPESVSLAATRWPDSSATQLEHGRQTMLKACNRCHGYASPAAYTPEEWTKITARMSKKAKLSADDETALLRYLVAQSSNTSKPVQQ